MTHGFSQRLIQRNLPRPVLRVAGFVACTLDSDDDIVRAIDTDAMERACVNYVLPRFSQGLKLTRDT